MKRCETCPRNKIAELRSTSEAGRLLTHVLDLEYATTSYMVDWGDVPADQAEGLRILQQERRKREIELMKERQAQANPRLTGA
jgi:hypothetical protein